MELSLSLGDTPKPFIFLDKSQKMVNKDLGFCMPALGPLIINGRSEDKGDAGESHRQSKRQRIIREVEEERRGSSDHPPVQLDLYPFSPVLRNQLPSQLRFPWPTQNLISEPGSSNGPGKPVEVNRQPLTAEEAEDGAAALSSPNSTVFSSFQMDFSMYRSGKGKRYLEATVNEVEADRGACSRASDEEENGLARKKLRLTKEQSAFLEESFKEHHTLNPKQKLVLAKQLNLRPRQVEVWFQNRRARRKLKQTEMNCEYLKRCCETLAEENRRLQKELQELRALKTSQPFSMQLPATTLTMCPSCECVASSTTSPATTIITTANAAAATNTNATLSLAKPRIYPSSHAQVYAQQAAS